MRVLLLGGTAEARALAALLVHDGDQVTTSLAGRVSEPRLPVGDVRIGGFGGVDGLRAAATDHDVVVDATHPFARTISTNAALACSGDAGDSGRPLLRLQRPGWQPPPGADWTWVDDHPAAAAIAAAHERPFLTTGRQTLADFTSVLATHRVLARVVEPVRVPEAWTLLLSRGPYTRQGEVDLMTGHGVDILLTKDSGGDHVRAKLDAAAALRVPVVVVRRPAVPDGVSVVADVDDARRWVRAR